MLTIQQRDLDADKVELLVRVICTKEQAEKLTIEAICNAAAKNLPTVNQDTYEDQTP